MALMGRWEQTATAPARLRRGLPVLPDGTRRHPILLALPAASRGSRCNNGCERCLTHAVEDGPGWDSPTAGRHVVVRDREPTLRRDLESQVRHLQARGAATVTVLTNGRMLLYEQMTRNLVAAGVDRFVVKLFGVDATAHDRHTRVGGSFEQTLDGVAVARTTDAEVHVTFPTDAGDESSRIALAQQVTGADPVEMPEPEVVVHANEYRYEVVTLNRSGQRNEVFASRFFPMAHVQTGPRCNIRCTYCNVHGGSDPRLFERGYIEQMVEDAAEHVARGHTGAGRPTLDFIGGEPTLHPELPQLVRHARDSGFPETSICTNGVMLHKRPGYLQELLDAGLTCIRYSFHDHRAGSANDLANIQGLGDHYPETAVELLSRRDVHTHFFRILLANTLDVLPEYLRFLHRHNRTGRPIDLALGMPSMRGRLFENPHIYPSLDRVRDAVGEAVVLCRELGIDLFVHHAPACLHFRHPELASCLNVDTLQYDSLQGSDEELSFEGDARYGRACEGCAAREGGCHGVPGAYWDADPVGTESWLRPL